VKGLKYNDHHCCYCVEWAGQLRSYRPNAARVAEAVCTDRDTSVISPPTGSPACTVELTRVYHRFGSSEQSNNGTPFLLFCATLTEEPQSNPVPTTTMWREGKKLPSDCSYHRQLVRSPPGGGPDGPRTLRASLLLALRSGREAGEGRAYRTRAPVSGAWSSNPLGRPSPLPARRVCQDGRSSPAVTPVAGAGFSFRLSVQTLNFTCYFQHITC
jgi:hypothetical protein